MNTATYTLPAYWASALVNGDQSALTDEQAHQVLDWLELEKPGTCVGCSEEAFFSWVNDAGTLGGDCLFFEFHQGRSLACTAVTNTSS